jgi:deaminated glutathione amidase
LKISLVQMNSVADKPANIAAATALIERAVEEERPDLVALPECFDFLGGQRADKMAAAEVLGEGPAYDAMRELAARHRIVIHAGSMLERVAGQERIHNTTVVFGRDGGEVARYRKIHMFDVVTPDGASYRESASFAPGDAVVTYECEGVTVGCAICYDLRFPHLFQALADRGAQVILLPSAFTLQTGKDHWEVLCRARAIETQTYFAAPAQTGTHTIGEERRQTYGHSLIVDPWGLVVARASDGPGLTSARIDLARVHKVREQIPVQAHRVALRREATAG